MPRNSPRELLRMPRESRGRILREAAAKAESEYRADLEESLCPDCAAAPGETHQRYCDVARCLASGMQRLACGCGQCGEQVWTGEWPGESDCRRLGWFTSDGEPDLNRLNPMQARWDTAKQRWEAIQ